MFNRYMLLWVAILLIPIIGTGAEQKENKSQSRKAVLGLTVKVNKETPRVLTIVPWRLPEKDANTPDVRPTWQPAPTPISPKLLHRELEIFHQRHKTRNVNQILDSE